MGLADHTSVSGGKIISHTSHSASSVPGWIMKCVEFMFFTDPCSYSIISFGDQNSQYMCVFFFGQ